METLGLMIQVFVVKPFVWLVKHRVALVGIAIVIVGIVIWRSCAPKPLTENEHQIRLQNQAAPAKAVAPTVMQTYSRVYYLVSFQEISDDKVVLYCWYEWNGEKWMLEKSDGGISFDRSGRDGDKTRDYRLYKR